MLNIDVLSSRLKDSNLILLDVVLEYLDDIFQRYIIVD
jgi:hypothetical protein